MSNFAKKLKRIQLRMNFISPLLSHRDEEEESGVAILDRPAIKKPKRYKVLIHNDDYTTMEFVIDILTQVFLKSETEAKDVMVKVHMEGIGVCGIYTFEVAETKLAKVVQMAKENGHPLRCSLEQE